MERKRMQAYPIEVLDARGDLGAFCLLSFWRVCKKEERESKDRNEKYKPKTTKNKKKSP